MILHGDCCEVIPQLPDYSIRACITSPPYAMQRKNYDGITPENYPAWTLKWMEILSPKLCMDGSVLIVIRSSVEDGVVSDYVMNTRLLLRSKGWLECEELIWLKPDGPPLGSIYRPRRTWENILWFSKTNKPYVNLKACGNKKSTRTGGFAGSNRFSSDENNPIAKQQNPNLKEGTSRCTDVFTAYIGEMQKGVMHPAMYPPTLTDQLVLTFSEPNDTILDPFCGSGTTLISANRNGRKYIGIDNKLEYIGMANKALEQK